MRDYRRTGRPVLRRIARLWPQSRSGAAGMMLALSLPILVIVCGFAADYGYASYLSQQLSRASDSATLAAVSQTAATSAGGYANLNGLQTFGNSVFNENVKAMKLSNVSFNLKVVSDGDGGVIATGAFTYNAPAFFGGLIGRSSFPLSGTIQASARPPVYANYYILVDTSQSMGIAATPNDMTALYNRVSSYGYGGYDGDTGCVFGCHVAQTGQQYTNEQLAHNISPNITLRIDSAKQALQNIISEASLIVGQTKNISFALYEIQKNPFTNSMLTNVAPLSTNYTTLSTQAGTIDLGTNDPTVGYGDTDYVNELAAFNALLPPNGTGASATSPLNFVFIITDGLQDTTSGSCPWTHCTGPLDSSRCAALQAKATVGVIYTTYLPIMQHANPQAYDSAYQALVLPYANQIQPALQACATSNNYFFQATYANDIISAVQALFEATLPISARLSR